MSTRKEQFSIHTCSTFLIYDCFSFYEWFKGTVSLIQSDLPAKWQSPIHNLPLKALSDHV